MKITGAELRLFLGEGWPGDDWYWDTEIGDDDPDGLPRPDAEYDADQIEGLFWQGQGPKPDGNFDFLHLFRKWRKDRSYDLLTVQVPKANTAVFLASLTGFDAKKVK